MKRSEALAVGMENILGRADRVKSVEICKLALERAQKALEVGMARDTAAMLTAQSEMEAIEKAGGEIEVFPRENPRGVRIEMPYRLSRPGYTPRLVRIKLSIGAKPRLGAVRFSALPSFLFKASVDIETPCGKSAVDWAEGERSRVPGYFHRQHGVKLEQMCVTDQLSRMEGFLGAGEIRACIETARDVLEHPSNMRWAEIETEIAQTLCCRDCKNVAQRQFMGSSCLPNCVYILTGKPVKIPKPATVAVTTTTNTVLWVPDVQTKF